MECRTVVSRLVAYMLKGHRVRTKTLLDMQVVTIISGKLFAGPWYIPCTWSPGISVA